MSVCYFGVNGRDGAVFDSSYERGEPLEFPLNDAVPGFQRAIAGQRVGSTVAVAMKSADGYPNGNPSALPHGVGLRCSTLTATNALPSQSIYVLSAE